MSFRNALNTLIKSGYNRGIKSDTTSAIKQGEGLPVDPFDASNNEVNQDKKGLEEMTRNAAQIAKEERQGSPINPPEGGNTRA